jgi:hypothetical protein
MIAPTNNNNFSPKLMNLRGLIGMFILVNAALASQDSRVVAGPNARAASEVSSIRSIQTEYSFPERDEPQKEEWTLSAQKHGSTRNNDASLSAIKISYQNNTFRLVNMFRGGDKTFYFAKVKQNPQESVLDLTDEDFDRENNSVTLRMKACSKWTRVCDRRIFYLDQDGPNFFKFLIEQGKITYNGEDIDESMDLFKRQTKGVIGYTVTLMKDDWKNKNITGLMPNWTGLNKMMGQTSKLRVHMNENGTVKHFEISQMLGTLEFEIANINGIMYNEEQNSVLLKIERSRAYKKVRADRTETVGGCFKNLGTSNGPENRYLYLDANTDSKKFLLFLMEMYHEDYSGKNTVVFSKAAAAAIPTIFQELNAEGEKLVKEYIEERGTENAAKFETGLVRIRSTSIRRRRLIRLVEAERCLME